MKQQYGNISLTPGFNSSGICSIKVAAREWISDQIIPDFNTGIVTSAIEFIFGKDWLTLEFAPDTYQFEEKPKSSRNGDYFEITLEGLVNNLTPEMWLILESIRHHELIALVKDKRKRLKLVGNKDAGMHLRYSSKEENKQGGNQVIAIDLTMDTETATPFYEP